MHFFEKKNFGPTPTGPEFSLLTKKKVILRIYFLGSMGSKTHFKHLYFSYFFFRNTFGGAILGQNFHC